ncbi:MAG: hypothetical protein KAJ55_05495 [Anaerolineales bacterium]|nr:hypothetical protein [Anaerolineales bacterium]
MALLEKQGELAQPYNEALDALRHAGLQPRQKVGPTKPGPPNAAEADSVAPNFGSVVDHGADE